MPRENELRRPDESSEKIESKEAEQGIHFNILYTSHNSPEDIRLLDEAVSQTDIYFPENAGWNPETESAYRAYATGRYEIPENLDSILKSELKTLSRLGKSGKVIGIGFVDLPEGHPLLSQRPESSQKAIAEFESGNFDKAIQEIKKMAESKAMFNRQREDYITEQIQLKIQEILASYPQLKEKLEKEGRLNVLLSLGTFHTKVFHNIKEKGKNVEQKFGQAPYSLGPLHELEKRYLFGEKVDDDLAARALLFSELSPDMAFSDDTVKIYQTLNKITSSLKTEDIKKISLRLKLCHPIVKILKDLKVNVPRSKKAMDKFIAE